MNRRDKLAANDYLEVEPNIIYNSEYAGNKNVSNSWKFHFEPTYSISPCL